MKIRTDVGWKLGVLCAFWCVACTPKAARPAPDLGADEPTERPDTLDASSSSQTSGSDPMDAQVTSASGHEADAGLSDGLPNDAALGETPTSGGDSFHDDAQVQPVPSVDAGQLILEPEVSTYDVAALCDAVWALQGRVIETDLSGSVVKGEWAAVEGGAATNDVGIGSSDAGNEASGPLSTSRDAAPSDASTCSENFAPYVVACAQGPILIQSPSLVYGQSPSLGGEPLSAGCWQRECDFGCVPASEAAFARVRARVSPVSVFAEYDGGPPIAVGSVRVNGVEVEAIATLEVTDRLQ